MDNASFRIPQVKFDVPVLTAALIGLDINVTRKTLVKQGCELLLFSMPVGPHKCRWLLRANLTDNTIACSGGVTKTFFAQNVWVFRNENTQLAAIMGIVRDALLQIDGITLKCANPNQFLIERVELTNHFVLPKGVSPASAINKIDVMFMTLFPRRYSPPEGRTHDNPGTVRLGRTKSSRTCRVYDPISKLQIKPSHVSSEVWAALKTACAAHLRIELMFNKRELQAAGLTTLAGWENTEKVAALVAARYQHFGLSVEFKATNNHFSPGDVGASNPTFIDYARHWFSAGAKGVPPNPRSGAFNRFKQYMAAKGYRTDVPFARHQFLVHGLHDVLVPERSAELPDELRRDPALFCKWWMAL